jgi:O-antigen ligase
MSPLPEKVLPTTIASVDHADTLAQDVSDQRQKTGPPRAHWLIQAGSVVRALIIAAAAVLFLSAAGTIEVVYTVRPSYLLIGVALVIGAPFLWRGWLRLGDIRWWALGLLLAYVIATIAAETVVLAGEGRGGGYREFVYLADLIVGLVAVGLVAALWTRPADMQALAVAFVLGAAAAAAYGLYQWPAQHYGWPFDDVNNTLDSSGVTRGASQGNALLGWERIRGTFVEPHFLAGYLASVLPLCVGLAYAARGIGRYFAFGSAALLAAAIVLTASIPAVLALAVGAITGFAIFVIALGHVRLARALGGFVVIAFASALLLLTSPELAAPVTGRGEAEIAKSMEFRKDAWDRAINVWAQRPLTGYGPGQSSVRLAWETAIQESTGPPRVLGSSHGLWAASLVDGGVLAFGLWAAFLAAVLFAGARLVVKAPNAFTLALFVSTCTAVAASEVSGDRLDLRVWLLIGALLAATGELAERHGNEGGEKAEAATD